MKYSTRWWNEKFHKGKKNVETSEESYWSVKFIFPFFMCHLSDGWNFLKFLQNKEEKKINNELNWKKFVMRKMENVHAWNVEREYFASASAIKFNCVSDILH